MTPPPPHTNHYHQQSHSPNPPTIRITAHPIPYTEYDIAPRTLDSTKILSFHRPNLTLNIRTTHTTLILHHNSSRDIPTALHEGAAMIYQHVTTHTPDSTTTSTPRTQHHNAPIRHHIHLSPTDIHITTLDRIPHLPAPALLSLTHLLQYAAETLDTNMPTHITLEDSYLPPTQPTPLATNSPTLHSTTRQSTNHYHRQAALGNPPRPHITTDFHNTPPPILPTPTTPPLLSLSYQFLLELNVWTPHTTLDLYFLTTEDLTGTLRYGALFLQQEADAIEPPSPHERQPPMPPLPPTPLTQWTHHIYLGDDHLRIQARETFPAHPQLALLYLSQLLHYLADSREEDTPHPTHLPHQDPPHQPNHPHNPPTSAEHPHTTNRHSL